MADLSNVVSFLAFCEPGRGASWIVDLRGPGRFAVLGLEDEASVWLGTPAVGETVVVSFDDVSLGAVEEESTVSFCVGSGSSRAQSGHFFASSEFSGTSVTSLRTDLLASTLTKMGKNDEKRSLHDVFAGEPEPLDNLYHLCWFRWSGWRVCH